MDVGEGYNGLAGGKVRGTMGELIRQQTCCVMPSDDCTAPTQVAADRFTQG